MCFQIVEHLFERVPARMLIWKKALMELKCDKPWMHQCGRGGITMCRCKWNTETGKLNLFNLKTSAVNRLPTDDHIFNWFIFGKPWNAVSLQCFQTVGVHRLNQRYVSAIQSGDVCGCYSNIGKIHLEWAQLEWHPNGNLKSRLSANQEQQRPWTCPQISGFCRLYIQSCVPSYENNRRELQTLFSPLMIWRNGFLEMICW